MRTYPLKLGARYRITSGGALYPHLVGEKVRILLDSRAEVLTGSGRGRVIATEGLGLRAAPERELCKGCAAYAYPHRKGSGKCLSGDAGPFCGQCGLPCNFLEVAVDDPYKGRTLVSTCCGDQIFSDSSLHDQLTLKDLQDGSRS